MPTTRALVLLGLSSVAFVAALGGPTWLAVMGALMDLALVALVGWDALQARGIPLEVQRKLPERVHQHEPVEVQLWVSHPGAGSMPILIRVRDSLHPFLVRATDSPQDDVHTIHLESGRPHIASTTVTALRRGRVVLGPVDVRVPGPLGLALHQRSHLRDEVIRVLPQARLDGRDGLQLARLLRSPQGAYNSGRHGRSHSLAHLREYARGDSRRAIHWRASARRHRPVTRVTRRADHQRTVLLVDAGRTMAAATDTRSRLDRMLAAVLGFSRVAIRLNNSVSIVVYGAGIRKTVHLDPRTRRFADAFDALHDLHARREESSPGEAAAWVRNHAPKGATVVWCTSVTDSAGTERLFDAARTVARRHDTVLLNLLDSDLHRLARQDPSDLHGAYEKASALARRDRLNALARTLTGAGIAVVQSPADRLVIGLVAHVPG